MSGLHGDKDTNPVFYSAASPGARSNIEGRFGRLFPLEEVGGAHPGTPTQLKKLGESDGPMQATRTSNRSDNARMPAGYTFFGQFVDHDVTLDLTSSFFRRANLAGIVNGRTASLDLDCIYGAGPEGTPFLYTDHGRLLHVGDSNGIEDLPRFKGRALIGDPRNDENIVVGHLQLAFIKFHNKIAEDSPEADHEKIRDTVVHYYHRIIVEDFLSRLIGRELVQKILCSGRCYYYPEGFGDVIQPYMPVEFAGAAYRYGHSQVRQSYTFNAAENGPLFQQGSFKPFATALDLRYFFDVDNTITPQSSREIDRLLPPVLFNLPFAETITSLAERNLHRGRSFRLPSGEHVAHRMLSDGLIKKADLVPTHDIIKKLGMACTPLWFYILNEAGVKHDGDQLGPVGGRIVGEVLLGLIEHYRDTLPGKGLDYIPDINVPSQDDGIFTVADMLRYIA